jgi:hypothetical protein
MWCRVLNVIKVITIIVFLGSGGYIVESDSRFLFSLFGYVRPVHARTVPTDLGSSRSTGSNDLNRWWWWWWWGCWCWFDCWVDLSDNRETAVCN